MDHTDKHFQSKDFFHVILYGGIIMNADLKCSWLNVDI